MHLSPGVKTKQIARLEVGWRKGSPEGKERVVSSLQGRQWTPDYKWGNNGLVRAGGAVIEQTRDAGETLHRENGVSGVFMSQRDFFLSFFWQELCLR